MNIMRNLASRVMLMLAPDGAGGGNAANGSADNGAPAPGNAEDLLQGAFGNANADGAAGADGKKPEAKPDEGNNAQGGTTTGSEEAKLAAWCEQLPPEIRGNPEMAAKLAKYPKVGDMAKAFLELSAQAAGKAAGIPGKNATAEEAAAFWEKAGKPKTADGYAFAKDAANEGTVFAQAAFAANLTADQAEAMFKSLNAAGSQRMQAAVQAQNRQGKETAAALAAEYGSKYEEKIELLARGLAAAGPNVGSLLRQAGLAGNPEIVKAFIAFGEMTAESGAARGGGAGEPMKTIREGGSFDYKD